MNKLEIPPIKTPSITESIFLLSNQSLRIIYEDPKVHPPKVSEWLKKEGRWGKHFYIICTIYAALRIASAFYLDYSSPHAHQNLLIRAGDSLFHALIMCLGAIFVYRDNSSPSLDAKNLSIGPQQSRERVEKALARASEAIKRFFPYWRLTWLFWFFLYLTLAMNYYFSTEQVENLWFFNTISNAFNNFTALFFYAMYHELSERTVNEESKKGLWQILLMVLLLIAAVELALSWHFHLKFDRNNLDNPLSNTHFVFSTISGVLTGFATALLTIRFASRIIGVPKGAIFMLVIYCVIQPLFPMVSSPSKNIAYAGVAQVAVSLAIYGKATLLVIIHWMRSTHRLTYYMVRTLEMLEEEGSKRIAFVNELLPVDEKIVSEDSILDRGDNPNAV